jgi:hypothetical protein
VSVRNSPLSGSRHSVTSQRYGLPEAGALMTLCVVRFAFATIAAMSLCWV